MYGSGKILLRGRCPRAEGKIEWTPFGANPSWTALDAYVCSMPATQGEGTLLIPTGGKQGVNLLAALLNYEIIIQLKPSLSGRIFQVKLESKFASIILSIALLEGVGRSLDPECNILQAAVPVIARATSELTTSIDGVDGA